MYKRTIIGIILVIIFLVTAYFRLVDSYRNEINNPSINEIITSYEEKTGGDTEEAISLLALDQLTTFATVVFIAINIFLVITVLIDRKIEREEKDIKHN